MDTTNRSPSGSTSVISGSHDAICCTRYFSRLHHNQLREGMLTALIETKIKANRCILNLMYNDRYK